VALIEPSQSTVRVYLAVWDERVWQQSVSHVERNSWCAPQWFRLRLIAPTRWRRELEPSAVGQSCVHQYATARMMSMSYQETASSE